jgi:hypothetical protein
MPTVIASLRSNPEALIVCNLHKLVIGSLRNNPETQIVSNLRKLVIGSLRSNPLYFFWIASQATNDVCF